MSRRHQLLLIEDDASLAEVMASYLRDYEVTTAADGGSGLAAALKDPVDVIVIDRMLPVMEGTEVVRRVRQARMRTPILMLTALGTVADKVAGLDSGANDYLVKPFDFDELEARLRALLRTYEDTGSLPIGDWDFFPADRIINSPYIGPIVLTPKESSLLELLAHHPERTYGRDEILKVVFSPTDTPGTVDTYVHYLRQKTEQSVIVTVRRRGYRLGAL